MRNRAAIIDSYFTLPVEALSQREWKKLQQACSYVDAEGIPHQCFRPRKLVDAVRLPRGAWALVPDHVRYRDKRAFPLGKKFQLDENFVLDGTLPDGRSFHGQQDAVNSIFKEEQGIIVRPPGTGKTQIAVAFMAQVGTRCLVLVHTEDVMDQWYRYLIAAGIPKKAIGIIRGEKRQINRPFVLAMVQTYYKDVLEDTQAYRGQFGAIIIDEAHHAPAGTWEIILNNSDARYRIGLTASPTRADGHHPYIRLLIGPVIHKQKFEPKVKTTVVIVPTNFNYRYRGSWDWGNLIHAVISDDERNETIANIVDREAKRENSILVLSRRIEHLERIAERLDSRNEILTGSRKSDDRRRILDDFRNGRVRVLLATQLADEALDVPVLSRIVLSHPGKAEGRIIQQIGRALREHPGKEDAIIYDFYDKRVRILRSQFQKRKGIYKRLKLKVKKRRRK